MARQVDNWIANWLSGRKQSGCEWEDVSSGVLQGSVLGPLLFIIYINDLESGVKSRISKFADDIKLGGKVDSRGGGDQIHKCSNGEVLHLKLFVRYMSLFDV